MRVTHHHLLAFLVALFLGFNSNWWVVGLECWDCDRCKGNPSLSDNTTGKVVNCTANETCWILVNIHGDEPPSPNNTNTHRLCEPRRSDPPVGKKCKEVTEWKRRGYECQCDTDRCNMNLSNFIVPGRSPPTVVGPFLGIWILPMAGTLLIQFGLK